MIIVWAIVKTPSPATTSKTDEAQQRRGPVLEVLRELLDEGEDDAVVEWTCYG